jgi:hypothetical protein
VSGWTTREALDTARLELAGLELALTTSDVTDHAALGRRADRAIGALSDLRAAISGGRHLLTPPTGGAA